MNRTAWIVVIGVVALVVLLNVAGFLIGRPLLGYGWGMMGPGMMGGFFGFPFLGGILMLAFWVLVIAGIVWLVQSLARGAGRAGTGVSGSETPLDILKRRYAAGEISQEQFDEMKRNLLV